MNSNEVKKLITLMGESIEEKISKETSKLFLKIILFVSFNNLIIGTMFLLLT